ncbi:MAG: substrate-binding domain-containing protein [Propionibacteriaceae bacterium]|jgi:ribose transport system substrate-binding protein|nr:substrate-binding domain-containing protein [Propionibacteriaceae bacterium]
MRKFVAAGLAAVMAVSLAACQTTEASKSDQGPGSTQMNAKIDAALADITGKVLSTGPHGEAAEPASAVELTDAEIQQVKDKKLTAAIALHYGGNDWANAQVAGLTAQFEKLGIEIVAKTDANFDPAQQVSDIETIMAKHPDIIVSIPTDAVATASAYKKAAEAGIKLVFMDNAPNGLVAGKDYVTVVSADNYGNGVVSAHLMAKTLGGKGDIAVIYHEADFFVTAQRYEGFKTTIAEQYPDIHVVDTHGIAGPDFAGDAQAVADAVITQKPSLKGIWAVWDVPAEGVMAAARAADRMDLKIATEDLGTNVAIALAKNELVVGLGAQLPYDQGVAEADAAAGALLGKTAPAYVAVSALPVTHDNVLDAWRQVYHAEPPASLAAAFDK